MSGPAEPPSASLGGVVRQARVVICCGTGGVGLMK